MASKAADKEEQKQDAQSSSNKTFVAEKMSASVRNAKYAVRGAIVKRAYAIQAELKANKKFDKFDKVIFCNIGNPQAFTSPPITFHRQVLACIMYPPLMKDNTMSFPKDVIERAKRLLDSTAHQNIGAYTNSRGLLTVRESVAKYLNKRDGFAANPEHIFLTNGASTGIGYAMQCLIASENDGILIPIPQYPLYSATITLNNGKAVNYYLDEDDGWNANLKSIENAIAEAKKNGINIKALSVINPGNPTGQCMTKECIEGIIAIAAKHNFVILADEVYQENIYYAEDFPFVSFRKTLLSSAKYKDSVELISFHSVSKGIFGECGLRGGYFEVNNIEQSGIDMLVKLASINLCPNTIGQCMVDMMVNPPTENDESYKLFKEEYEKQFGSLRERAKILTKALNGIDGISCTTVYGAMYAFPNIVIPDQLVENVCNALPVYKGQSVDYIYCMELLENYGICVIPGSGFGQKKGSYHLRTTILPPKDEIEKVAKSLEEFHSVFIKAYS